VTRGSRFNHNYVRRALGGHPEFAAFWADGDPDRFSESRLYFSDISGRRVWRLPERMSGEEAAPERA
jgi:hypothetical protein